MILKFPIKRQPNEYGAFNVMMPIGALILSVIEQNGDLMLYALCSVNTEKQEELPILVIGTGKEIPEETYETHKFLGTVKQNSFVWHVLVPNENTPYQL